MDSAAASFLLPRAAAAVLRRRSNGCRRRLFAPRACSPSRTQRIMESISSGDGSGGEVGGAGGAYSYAALKKLDQVWSSMCSAEQGGQKAPDIVTRVPGSAMIGDDPGRSIGPNIFDVIVCGGTLGIFIATALSSKGLKVGIVERNMIKGRDQEWNISRKEILELAGTGILTEEEVKEIITSEFNPNRCGFENRGEIWVENILNLGVSPAKLVEILKERFVSLGGAIFEGRNLSSVVVYDDVAVAKLSDGTVLPSQIILDCMGNFSPIVRQVRCGRKPDGVCLVVGSCSRGFSENKTSDVIFSSSSTQRVGNTEVHLFWEAFPAGIGSTDRTTYMFTYVNPQTGGPKLEELLEDYWNIMPAYQNVSLDSLEVRRVIFGIFPTYRDSPLPPTFDRVLQVGDASGIQSPVSFGGFGSLTRHLGRLSNGVYEAVEGNFVDADSLTLLNPYMPNLSASWLFQRAMSAQPDAGVPPTFINDLLHANFDVMQKLGDPVLRPFLQDVIQFGALVKTLGLVMIGHPQLLPSIFRQVGLGVILNWSVHFMMLGYYTILSVFIDPIIRPLVEHLPKRERYEWRRYLETWRYGAGLDYHLGDGTDN